MSDFLYRRSDTVCFIVSPPKKLWIMHYKLWIISGRSGYAVGLSAISLLAPSPPRSPNSVLFPIPVPVPVPVPKSRPQIPSPHGSQRMPLQSLTLSSLQVNKSTSLQVTAIIKFVRTHYASQKTNSSVGAKDYKQTVSTQCGTSAQTNHDRPERCRRDRTITIEMTWAYIL